MSQSADTPTSHSRAAEIATPSPTEVRTSKQRAEEIKQYILGLLPAHISKSVDVVITEQVPTAAVLPATEDALLTDEQTEFDRQQARRLIESVDGDYLVLITARETPDAAPLDDELSADRAHQFGLAFHETLHILKTAFKGIQTLLTNNVEDQHRDIVHDLINATEDGAIEHEVYVGEDFSTRAGNRLRLVREIHKRKPGDYEALPEDRSKFTFRDALQKALHDNVILPPSGTTSALLDEDDDRVTFASDEERTVFLQIYPEIERLADDIHSIRGDVGTELHRNDAEASIRRAKRTIKFWHEVVKPLVDTDASEQEQDQQQQSGGDGQPNQSGEEGQGQGQDQQQQQGQAGESSSSTQSSSAGSDGDSQQGATQTGSQSSDSPSDSSGEVAPSDDISPEDLSLERNAVSDSLQGVADHPSITDEPNPDDVDLNPDSAEDEADSDDSTNSSAVRENEDEPSQQESDSGPSTGTDSDSTPDEIPDVPGQPDSGEGDGSDEGESSTGGQDSATGAAPEDGAGESESHSGGEVEVESESDSSDLASSTQSSSGTSAQSTFGDFAQDESGSEGVNGNDNEGETGGESEAEGGQTTEVSENEDASGEQESGSDQSGDTSGESTSSENAESTDQNGTSSEGGSSPSQSRESGESGQPAEGGAPTASGASQSQDSENGQPDVSQQSRGSSSTGGEQSTSSASTSGVSGPEKTGDELSSEDFESDRKRAQQTADEISSDGDALQRELEALDKMLGEEAEADPDGEAGGSGAGAGSIDELSVLPDSQGGSVSETDWETVEKAAGTVADTLAKQLQLDQQTGVRSGLTSGTTVNRKTAYRLGYGDPRVFDTQIPGDEKEYFIVIVLDRSGSMDPTRYDNGSDGPTKIQVATSAVARFAVACEDLGIDVAVVDFYDDTARLAKPASVDAEFAQETLLNTDAGGGTPLSDALTLATSLSEMDSKESIIITMTDGKPRDVDGTAEVIKQSYAPVCSLTVATDCEPGNPPERAAKLEPHFDQTTTVFDPEKLDDRLDQFAALLGMY